MSAERVELLKNSGDYSLSCGEVNSVEYFPPKYLVYSDSRGRVVVLDISKKVELSVLNCGKGYVYMKKFDETSVVCCCGKIVYGYRFDFKEKKVEHEIVLRMKMQNRVSRVVKVSESEVVACVWESPLVLIDFKSKTKSDLTARKESRYLTFGLLRSKVFENSFFYCKRDPGAGGNDILLINFREDRTIRRMNNHSAEIHYLDSFVNSKGHEVIVGTNMISFVCVYDSFDGKLLSQVKNSPSYYDYNGFLMSDIRSKTDKILFCVQCSGRFRFVKIEEEGREVKQISRRFEIGGGSNDLYDATQILTNPGFCRIAVCGRSGVYVRSFESKDFDFSIEEYEEDFTERSNFLVENYSSFSVRKVSTSEVFDLHVPKILLLY